MQKVFLLCIAYIFFTLKARLQVLSLSFARLSWSINTNILAINWQNFARVRPLFELLLEYGRKSHL